MTLSSEIQAEARETDLMEWWQERYQSHLRYHLIGVDDHFITEVNVLCFIIRDNKKMMYVMILINTKLNLNNHVIDKDICRYLYQMGIKGSNTDYMTGRLLFIV